MSRVKTVEHRFVDEIPDVLAERTVYVCIPFATVVHACLCGCGDEIVTPLDPTEWRMTYDGETISLAPSVGNWSSRCESHYWIVKNEVRWSVKWPRELIDAGREADRRQRSENNGVDLHPGFSGERRESLGWMQRVWLLLSKLVRR